MVGEPSTSADAGGSEGALDEQRAAPPWRRRAVLAPAVAVVALFLAGLVVANLPGEGIHPFASLFVGMVWSFAALIVVVAVLGVVVSGVLSLVG